MEKWITTPNKGCWKRVYSLIMNKQDPLRFMTSCCFMFPLLSFSLSYILFFSFGNCTFLRHFLCSSECLEKDGFGAEPNQTEKNKKRLDYSLKWNIASFFLLFFPFSESSMRSHSSVTFIFDCCLLWSMILFFLILFKGPGTGTMHNNNHNNEIVIENCLF